MNQGHKTQDDALSLLVVGGTREAFSGLAGALGACCLRLFHTEQAASAVAHVRRSPPDLVMVDLDALGSEGEALCSRLQVMAELAASPVLVLSSQASGDARARALDAGATDWLQRPIDPVELKARVRAAARSKRLYDRLAEEAFRDALTGLWNRRAFDQRLQQELETARAEASSVSLILLDLDLFKQLNDRHGHLFGDMVLGHVAAVLARSVRAGDAACRYGGEEFAIVLRDADLRVAGEIAERIRRRISEVALIDGGRRVPVTASLGLACFDCLPETSFDGAALVESADRALYAAKRAGRNQVCSGAPAEAELPRLLAAGR
jgi:diguanylate cyclase (GGDEF)-like protein